MSINATAWEPGPPKNTNESRDRSGRSNRGQSRGHLSKLDDWEIDSGKHTDTRSAEDIIESIEYEIEAAIEERSETSQNKITDSTHHPDVLDDLL